MDKDKSGEGSEYQMPYSSTGWSNPPQDDPREVERLKEENRHLMQEICWLLKSQEHLAGRLKLLEAKMDKVKNHPKYKVDFHVLKRCLCCRKYRKAGPEIKKVFSLAATLKGGNMDEEFGEEEEDNEEEDGWSSSVGQGGGGIDDENDVSNSSGATRSTSKIIQNGKARRRKDFVKPKSQANMKKRKTTRSSSTSLPSSDITTQDSDNGPAKPATRRGRKPGSGNSKNTGLSVPIILSSHGDYICDQCGKVFTGKRAKQQLNSHVRYHNTPRPMVECGICGRKVKGKYKLAQHIKDHSRDKEFRCAICGKEFMYKYNMERHMLMHTGDKPYECDICHRTFRQKNQAEGHMQRIHVKKKVPRNGFVRKSFPCLDCNSGFAYFNCLIFHLKSEHVVTMGEEGGGEGEAILFNSIAQRHMLHYMKELPFIKGFPNLSLDKQLTHFEHPAHTDQCCTGDKKFQKYLGFKQRKNFPCTICGQMYAHQGGLQVHMRIHTDDRPYQCLVCNKRFRQRTHLATHMRHHRGEKKYKCSVCGKGYSGKPDMVKHVEKIHNNRTSSTNADSVSTPSVTPTKTKTAVGSVSSTGMVSGASAGSSGGGGMNIIIPKDDLLLSQQHHHQQQQHQELQQPQQQQHQELQQPQQQQHQELQQQQHQELQQQQHHEQQQQQRQQHQRHHHQQQQQQQEPSHQFEQKQQQIQEQQKPQQQYQQFEQQHQQQLQQQQIQLQQLQQIQQQQQPPPPQQQQLLLLQQPQQFIISPAVQTVVVQPTPLPPLTPSPSLTLTAAAAASTSSLPSTQLATLNFHKPLLTGTGIKIHGGENNILINNSGHTIIQTTIDLHGNPATAINPTHTTTTTATDDSTTSNNTTTTSSSSATPTSCITTTTLLQPAKPIETTFPPMSDFLSEEYNSSQGNQRYHAVVVPQAYGGVQQQ